MREYELVDSPKGVPWGCKFCQSAKGPLVDTYVEDAHGRVYVCKSCARRLARVMGFTPGKRLDQLNDALTNLEAKEAEQAAAAAEVTKLQAEVAAERAVSAGLASALEESLNRERTRAHLDNQLASLVDGRAHVGDPA